MTHSTHSPKLDLKALQTDLDDLRARTLAKLGAEDRAHIERVRNIARGLEASGRLLIHFSLDPFTFGLGVLGLGLYKIVENMELGHNVMHGQYDFLEDPDFDSRTYEWDLVGTAKTWKHGHNVTHHTYTNVLGKDDDFGYLFFRLSSDVAWKPSHVFQALVNPLSGLFFDHAVSYYHARPSEYLTAPEGTPERKKQRRTMFADWFGLAKKSVAQYAKEFVFYPALAGPFAPKVAAGNALAGMMRNVWTYAVIQCGHLTGKTNTFTEADLVGETRGGYYLRQILGSSNIAAGPVLGVLTGHLSHQIEHHLFPDIPAWRYPEMSVEVTRICEKHGLRYDVASFREQFGSVFASLVRYSVPNAPSDEGRRGGTVHDLTPPRAQETLAIAV
ncbi:MAG TPA: acyl-CoA desaturase [Polyangiaceae bacterium]|jgi:linoleoyl-CoA desaturase|nr:acyl-CoA desaturase [Polyangiaceae bacterium]